MVNIWVWLVDILLHAPTVEKLLDSVRPFFAMCMEYNIKLHLAKCIFLTRRCAGAAASLLQTVFAMTPADRTAFCPWEPQTTGTYLQQFVCALRWEKQAIPNYIELAALLHDFVESVHALPDKRTKRSVSHVLLAPQKWENTELDAFEACKKTLENQVTLVRRDQTQRLCVYTDVFKLARAGILTQAPM